MAAHSRKILRAHEEYKGLNKEKNQFYVIKDERANTGVRAELTPSRKHLDTKRSLKQD